MSGPPIPVPGGAVTCPHCHRSIGLSKHGRIAWHQSGGETCRGTSLIPAHLRHPAEKAAAIWIDPGRQGGQPCVYGSRVPVVTLVETADADGDEVALAAFPGVTVEDLAACRRFLAEWQPVDRRTPPQRLADLESRVGSLTAAEMGELSILCSQRDAGLLR